MSRSVRLRPWQKEALERFAVSERPDFLAVATPGAGKTTFALTAAVQDLVAHPERRVVVVAPTQHLKHQWARAAGRFDLHLEPQWSPRDGTPARATCTASSSPTSRSPCRPGPCGASPTTRS